MSQTTNSTFYQLALQQCVSVQSKLMQQHTLSNGEKVWVRLAGKRNSIWRYRLLKIAQKISGIHMLQPVPNLGGVSSLRTEVKRLQELAQANICVPKVLAQEPNATMISNIGEHNLEKEWWECHEDPKTLLQRWRLGLRAIVHVHQQQQYLSESFARNMIFINDQQIGFIDFEDDPLTAMPLTQCHARDLLCYLHSGAQLMNQFGISTEAQQAWHQIIAEQPASTQSIIQNSLRKIRWMRRFTAEFYGKDTLKLAAMANFN